MSAKIITFPSSQYSVCTPSPPEIHANSTKSGAKDQPDRTQNAGPRKDGRRKDDAKSRNVEPNIRVFSGVDGRLSYRVQIRKTSSNDNVNLTKTFSNLAMARKWKKKKLAEIEIEGVQAFSRGDDTVSDAISARLAKHTRLGRSAVQQLTWLKICVLGTQRLSDLTMASLYDLADDMLSQERQPQTVAGYLTILVNTLDWASRRDFNVPVPVLREAMKNMWEDEVFARSEERSRRPEKDELDRILAAVVANKRQKIPLAKIIVFALFSCRRIAEICRLRWDDLKVMEKKILVRDMKHPRKKKGNEPRRFCRRLQLMSRMEHHDKDNEQVFTRSTRTCRADGIGWRRAA